jgi:hypothetical protein
MIDGFWTGSGADWKGSNGHNPLAGRVTFGDGNGASVEPGSGNAFPIIGGTTDIAALLKNGPVMLGGAPGQTPAHWLLATGLTDDGKGVIAVDPVSGRLVVMTYDQDTKSLGGVAGFYDAKTRGLTQLADAGGSMPAGSGGVEALKTFTPASFLAVSIR